ncbi:MAG: hypothetical protein KAJ40_03220 [Alphaproteobacteria bacterium]|nr:hypothetical protein [Alphaproteobacteria bacterium]
MLVKCIGNSLSHLGDERAKKAYERTVHQEKVWLEIGEEYHVYGISFENGENLPYFLVCEDGDEFPQPHLGDFFEIIDGNIPSDWMFTTIANNVGELSFLPKKWALDTGFLEKIVDKEPAALDYFLYLKSLYTT